MAGSVLCQNGGTCAMQTIPGKPSTAVCLCPAGYTGRRCESTPCSGELADVRVRDGKDNSMPSLYK